MLFQIGLFFHMAALFLMGGGSLGMLIAENQLWTRVKSKSADAKTMLPLMVNAPKFIQAGVIVFLLSGLLMLYSVGWVFLTQPWFIAKLILFVILPLRGAIIAKTTVQQIANELYAGARIEVLRDLKTKMAHFHQIQYALAIIIVILVIFKP